MKVTVQEFDKASEIYLTADTVEDAALLIRIGMNSTREVEITAYAEKQGIVTLSISPKIAKNGNMDIPKRNR
jgi:hypothetical protein